MRINMDQCIHAVCFMQNFCTWGIYQFTAELETEENREQSSHMSDGDSEIQHFLELLLAPTSDSESESVGETDNESNSNNEMLSD